MISLVYLKKVNNAAIAGNAPIKIGEIKGLYREKDIIFVLCTREMYSERERNRVKA